MNTIAHLNIVGFVILMQNQNQHYFTEIVIRLNELSLAQETIAIRLRQLQLAFKSILPIWYLRKDICRELKTHSNFNGSVIQWMTMLGFAFDRSNCMDNWIIPGCEFT